MAKGKTSSQIADALYKLLLNSDNNWTRIFCTDEHNRLIDYMNCESQCIPNNNDTNCNATYGICVTMALALQAIHACLVTLLQDGFILPWLLNGHSEPTIMYRMLLDFTTGYKTGDDADICTTDLVAITLRRCNSWAGFFVESIYPIYPTNQEQQQ